MNTRQAVGNSEDAIGFPDFLSNRQIEAAELHKHKRQEVAASFAAVLASEGCLPPTAATLSGGGAPDEQLKLKAKALVAGLKAAAPTLPCVWDTTLPADPARCFRTLQICDNASTL